MGENCRQFSISSIEAHLLGYVQGAGPRTAGELSRVLGLQPSTLTSMLDRLEARGLLARSANPRDRRSWLVQLRPPGRRMAEKLRRLHLKLEAAVLAGLSEAQLSGFQAVMQSIGDVTAISLRPPPATHEKKL